VNNLNNYRKLISKIKYDAIEDIKYRKENRYWLRYSQKIAFKVLTKMNQEQLSKELVSFSTKIELSVLNNILKGKENLSLEQIVKLQDFLNIKILN
jgi:hypothetical protein